MAALAASSALLAGPAAAAPISVSAPMSCSRGPDFPFTALVTFPNSAVTGSTFTVRVDSLPSGEVSHGGLNYIHEMVTDFAVPAGTTYVEGSARIVAGTGTPNVRPGARAWRDPSGIHMAIPAHVKNGDSYTPPSLEFSLRIDAPAGVVLAVPFLHYQLLASVVILGDLRVACDPHPKPYAMGELHVVGPPPSPP